MIASGNTARSEWTGTNCFSDKLKCLNACSAKAAEGARNDECSRECDAKSAVCTSLAQSRLRTEQWKKRCFSLPDDKKYFADIIKLAWRQAAAALQAELMALRYFEARLQTPNPHGVNESTRTRELAEQIANLNKATDDYSHRLNAAYPASTVGVADRIFGDISKGASAFDVLSDAASKVVADALIDEPERRASIVEDTKSLRESAEALKQRIDEDAELSAAKEAMQTHISDLRSRILELQRTIDHIQSDNEASGIDTLFREVQAARKLCKDSGAS
jgi:hypothetical protein